MGEFLLMYGADIDAKNKKGKTPLQIALENEDENFESLLIFNLT